MRRETTSSWKPSLPTHLASKSVILSSSTPFSSLHEGVGVTDGEEVVEVTMEAFDVYPRETLERAWQSLFAVYGEIMGRMGDNSCKMPHLRKEKLASAGNLL
ncbi:unnamed protein product, partial [Discosporangium mesarthrocarpum]